MVLILEQRTRANCKPSSGKTKLYMCILTGILPGPSNWFRLTASSSQQASIDHPTLFSAFNFFTICTLNFMCICCLSLSESVRIRVWEQIISLSLCIMGIKIQSSHSLLDGFSTYYIFKLPTFLIINSQHIPDGQLSRFTQVVSSLLN